MRERENLVDRTKLGLENAKRQGKTLGRPWVEIDMKKVACLHNGEGMKYTAIAKKMGLKYSTLMKRLNKSNWFMRVSQNKSHTFGYSHIT